MNEPMGGPAGESPGNRTECVACRRPFVFMATAVPVCSDCWDTTPGRRARAAIQLALSRAMGPPPSPASPARPDPAHLSLEEVRELCALWQKRLRLQDWLVAVRIVPHWNMERDSEGRCDATLSRKMAIIDILEPGHLYEGGLWPNDMERTLVHELLHLHFSPFEAEIGTPADAAQEQAIDLIAGALVDLARSAQ
ncbi:MAG TPA: hypothetical protein VGM37_21205 [Armatimonadota bacterium]|jgi:hypothetical protein